MGCSWGSALVHVQGRLTLLLGCGNLYFAFNSERGKTPESYPGYEESCISRSHRQRRYDPLPSSPVSCCQPFSDDVAYSQHVVITNLSVTRATAVVLRACSGPCRVRSGPRFYWIVSRKAKHRCDDGETYATAHSLFRKSPLGGLE